MYYDYDSKSTEVPKYIVVKPNMTVESELRIRKDGSFIIKTREIKEIKIMKTFDIYFSDLNIATQKRLMDAVGISSPSEANWDIDMCPLAIYEFEVSNKDSRDIKRNKPRTIINVSHTIPNIDVSDNLNRRKRVDVTKLIL